MTKIQQSIFIKAPVSKVFSYISHYPNWTLFFEGISDVMPVTDKVHANGAKFIYKVKMMGLKFTVGTEFHDFVENQGWTGKSFKGLPHETNWILKDLNGSTEFTYIQQYSIPIFMGGKLIDKLILKKNWEKIIDKSLQNLKRIQETK
jgi:uncharacterized membrane protein